MSTDDFYSPPSSSVTDTPEPGSTDFDVLSGDILAYSPLALPADICVGCGSHEKRGKHYEKKIYYVPQWTLLLILINVIIMFIVHLIVRKRLDVTYYLCPQCLQKRKRRLLLIGAVGLLCIIGGVMAAMSNAPGIFLLGLVGFIVALIALVYFANPPIRARKHNDGLFTVKGASPGFLDEVAKQRGPDSSNAMW